MGTVTIPLTQGKAALIDEEDLHLVAPHKWYAYKNRNAFYAARTIRLPDGRRTTVTMHSAVLGLTKGQMVDHKDHDGLNNRRGNLRPCTQSQNQANAPAAKRNKSGYKGVSWFPRGNKWRARISVNHKTLHLGLYTDPWTAAQVYNAAALIHFGDFALINERTECYA